MKQALLLFMVLSIVSTLVAQEKFIFGLYAGAAIPTATYHHHDFQKFGFEFKDAHKSGIDVGAVAKFASVDPYVYSVISLSYMDFKGKKAWLNDSTFVQGKSTNYISLLLGVHIGKNVGPYFLPALSASQVEGHSRFGYSIGAGYVKALGFYDIKLDGYVSYSFLNVLGKDRQELSTNVLRVVLGILY